MNALTLISSTLTMTSLELVDFINEYRKELAIAAGALFPSEGFAKLRHDSFMDKVPEVLGKDRAPKFLGTQTYGTSGAGVRAPALRRCPGRAAGRDGTAVMTAPRPGGFA